MLLPGSALVAALAGFSILLGNITRTLTTEFIAGYGKVDLARIRQLHIIHDLDKFL